MNPVQTKQNFVDKALKHFMRLHSHLPIRYQFLDEKIEIFIYNNEKDFINEKEIEDLKKYLQFAKFDKNGWKIEPILAVKNQTFNYSDIYFKESFRYMTRLDIYYNDETI